jgi:hypothetical protein
MWFVNTSYDGVDGEAFDGIDGEAITQNAAFGPAKNFSSFSKAGKHQVSDLHKIIADTPFLSLEITSTKKSEGSKTGDPRISLQPHPWDSLDKLGKGSFSILVKSGDSYFLFIPTGVPEKLEESFRKNGGFLKSGIAGLEQVDIESIRIENGTYLKRN